PDATGPVPLYEKLKATQPATAHLAETLRHSTLAGATSLAERGAPKGSDGAGPTAALAAAVGAGPGRAPQPGLPHVCALRFFALARHAQLPAPGRRPRR
nr:hypothetical protein [Tanacetum cinerariifolium]